MKSSANGGEKARGEWVRQFLEWLSAVLDRRLLAALLILIVIVVLISVGLAAHTFASILSYKEALRIQAAQLENLQALFELHSTVMDQVRGEIEKATIVQELEYETLDP